MTGSTLARRLALFDTALVGAGAGAGSDVAADAERLLAAQTEIRDLKDAVRALREEMERMNAAREDAVQAVAAAGQDEVRQLHDLVRTLRAELEKAYADKDAAVQALRAAVQSETKQLQDAIVALRGELEHSRGH